MASNEGDVTTSAFEHEKDDQTPSSYAFQVNSTQNHWIS